MRPMTVRAALLTAIAAALAAPGLAAAHSGPAPPVPSPSTTVTPADSGRTVTITRGASLTVSLKGNNPSTGYAWWFTTAPNPAILELRSDTTAPPPARTDDQFVVGAPQPRTIVYVARRSGKTKLRLRYVGPSRTSARRLDITVNVMNPCRSGDLRATETAHGVRFSVAVRDLRARGVLCTRARHVARIAARRLLASRGTVPREIDGFRIAVRKPCGGCSPVTAVVATRRAARVTFTLAGGA